MFSSHSALYRSVGPALQEHLLAAQSHLRALLTEQASLRRARQAIGESQWLPPEGWQALQLEEARSLALTAYDPDAPTGSGWWHWFVVDLPLGLSGLAADAGAEGGAQLPAGARHIRNDYGAYAWGGMCPPAGDKPHRYVFTLHALSVPRLDIPDDASAALAGFMVNAHSLAKASFTVTYGR